MSDKAVNRKNIVNEGVILFYYVLGRKPTLTMLRRYYKAVTELRDGEALHIFKIVRAYPRLLLFLEPFGKTTSLFQGELMKRLQIVVGLSETEPTGAKQFCLTKTRSRILALKEIISIILFETFVIPIRLIVTLSCK